MYVPIPIPGWLYAIGYLLISFFGLKENRGNIGHDAHLGGAIIGFLIAAARTQFLPNRYQNVIDSLVSYFHRCRVQPRIPTQIEELYSLPATVIPRGARDYRRTPDV